MAQSDVRASQYGYGNPSPDLLERYREVYSRDGVDGDANRAALLWDSKGQSQDWAGQNAYGNFLQMVGREPTLQELQQFIPIYQGAYGQGNSAVANYAQMDAQKPQNLVKKAPQHYGSVENLFSQMLGRQATQEEKDHFGGLLASGQVDAYQLQDFLRGTPEYQTGEDKKFRGGLASELEGYDTEFFNKQKGNVFSDYLQRGFGGSSSLDYALTDLMGNIAKERGKYLADVSARQYGGNKELAIGNYRNTMDRYSDDRNYERNRLQNAYQQNYDRANEIGDYYTQERAYRGSRGGGQAPWGQLAGGALGAGIGAFAGGPMGASAGWNIGSGLGGGYDYLNQNR